VEGKLYEVGIFGPPYCSIVFAFCFCYCFSQLFCRVWWHTPLVSTVHRMMSLNWRSQTLTHEYYRAISCGSLNSMHRGNYCIAFCLLWCNTVTVFTVKNSVWLTSTSVQSLFCEKQPFRLLIDDCINEIENLDFSKIKKLQSRFFTDLWHRFWLLIFIFINMYSYWLNQMLLCLTWVTNVSM